ncbi:hypothetical protein [Collimonas fungivorans]|uniref:Uncharacterized protein n=1 Tax=Collimonas fungivorans (strain Ter331) TaxID=1005048 RepID=G0ABU7_COLFT|nr:hypothetical protein [Collimonas fungivorans]AEK61903.1 hypothetical protein CFU_2073 [Collimonas fungivorans Ter331]
MREDNLRGAEPEISLAVRSEFKSYLEHLSKDLSEEVRQYPTPIARCDEQLTKLIEQRGQAFQLLHRIGDSGQAEAKLTRRQLLAAVKDFLATPDFDHSNASEKTIRLHLRTALAALESQRIAIREIIPTAPPSIVLLNTI